MATKTALTIIQGIMIGGGSAAMFGPLIGDISRWFARRRGVAVAAAASGNYLAGAFWPVVMPLGMDAFGWRGTYLVMAAACLVTMVPLSLMLRRSAPVDRHYGGAGSRPIRSRFVFASSSCSLCLGGEIPLLK